MGGSEDGVHSFALVLLRYLFWERDRGVADRRGCWAMLLILHEGSIQSRLPRPQLNHVMTSNYGIRF
jgi:hypothetical protein